MIITMPEKIFGVTDLSSVLSIDYIIFMILIGLLISKEFLNLYFAKCSINRSDVKPNMGRLIDIAIIPFLFIFSYVFIFRLLN